MDMSLLGNINGLRPYLTKPAQNELETLSNCTGRTVEQNQRIEKLLRLAAEAKELFEKRKAEPRLQMEANAWTNGWVLVSKVNEKVL